MPRDLKDTSTFSADEIARALTVWLRMDNAAGHEDIYIVQAALAVMVLKLSHLVHEDPEKVAAGLAKTAHDLHPQINPLHLGVKY